MHQSLEVEAGSSVGVVVPLRGMNLSLEAVVVLQGSFLVPLMLNWYLNPERKYLSYINIELNPFLREHNISNTLLAIHVLG